MLRACSTGSAQAIKIAATDGDETEKERARVLLEKIECIKTGWTAGYADHPGPDGQQRAVSDKAQKTAYVADDPVYVRKRKPRVFLVFFRVDFF